MIEDLNSDKNVDGILLQLPLPKGLDGAALNEEIELRVMEWLANKEGLI